MKKHGIKIATITGVALFWVAVWQIIALLVAQELLVPAPLVVLRSLVHMVQQPSFWLAVALSMLRVIGGFLAAVLLGILLAVLTVRFRLMRVLFAPLLNVIRSAPVASFIILALVWIQTGILPAFISFITVLPMVWANVEKGIRTTDRRLLEMARVFEMSRPKVLLHIWIPSVLPYFLAACSTGFGFGWKSAVAAEIIARPDHSIGQLLQRAKMHYETPDVFGYTIVIALLSMVLERLLLAMIQRFRRGVEPLG